MPCLKRSFLLTVLLIVLFGCCSATGKKASSLQKYNIQGAITVSGISSGGYMAVQFHVSHSATVNGSAVFAGGPFYCAESNLEYATSKCMATTLGGPETTTLINLTKTDYSLGYIDDPSNMRNHKIYLWSGKEDTVVDPAIVHALESYYASFVKESNIVADFSIPAEHCMPTLDYGESCATLSSPFLGKCGFDGAGRALQQMYSGNLQDGGKQISSNLMAFDQTPFFSSSSSSIADIGYVYVPTACQQGDACSLHVSFHGCEQNTALIGNEYAEHAGYNNWAEANNIIVLYPYVKASNLVPYNPKGCWDWWAYTDVYYGVKIGTQVKFVKSLIDHMRG